MELRLSTFKAYLTTFLFIPRINLSRHKGISIPNNDISNEVLQGKYHNIIWLEMPQTILIKFHVAIDWIMLGLVPILIVNIGKFILFYKLMFFSQMLLRTCHSICCFCCFIFFLYAFFIFVLFIFYFLNLFFDTQTALKPHTRQNKCWPQYLVVFIIHTGKLYDKGIHSPKRSKKLFIISCRKKLSAPVSSV